MALACAAITVPNMMIVEMIAANVKAAVFMISSDHQYAGKRGWLRV
jgi:hypothetical protein